jgi:hypothetical protein
MIVWWKYFSLGKFYSVIWPDKGDNNGAFYEHVVNKEYKILG